MPSKRKRKFHLHAYLYVTHTSPIPEADGADLVYFPYQSLEAAQREVSRDVAAGVPPGVVYVRYSRVKSLTLENSRLRNKLIELTLNATDPPNYNV